MGMKKKRILRQVIFTLLLCVGALATVIPFIYMIPSACSPPVKGIWVCCASS